jgi:hypothetical protein
LDWGRSCYCRATDGFLCVAYHPVRAQTRIHEHPRGIRARRRDEDEPYHPAPRGTWSSEHAWAPSPRQATGRPSPRQAEVLFFFAKKKTKTKIDRDDSLYMPSMLTLTKFIESIL